MRAIPGWDEHRVRENCGQINGGRLLARGHIVGGGSNVEVKEKEGFKEKEIWERTSGRGAGRQCSEGEGRPEKFAPQKECRVEGVLLDRSASMGRIALPNVRVAEKMTLAEGFCGRRGAVWLGCCGRGLQRGVLPVSEGCSGEGVLRRVRALECGEKGCRKKWGRYLHPLVGCEI